MPRFVVVLVALVGLATLWLLLPTLWVAAPSFFDPGRAEAAFAAIGEAAGGKFDVIGLRITPTDVTADIVSDKAPGAPQTFRVAQNSLAGVLGVDLARKWEAGTAVAREGAVAEAKFPLDRAALAGVAKLARDAIDRSRLEQPRAITEMILSRAPASENKERPPLWNIRAEGAGARAQMVATLSGEIVSAGERGSLANAKPVPAIETPAGSQTLATPVPLDGPTRKPAPAAPSPSSQPTAADTSAERECEQSSDPQATVAACSRAITQASGLPAHDAAIDYNNRGVGYTRLKRWDAAREDFSKALELDGKYGQAWANRALVDATTNDYVRAAADATKAIQFNPDLSMAYGLRGVAEKHLSQWREAIADFSRELQLTDSDPNAYYNRGEAEYFGLGDLDAALADFNTAIQRVPNNAPALVDLGIVWRLKGDLGQAIAVHSRATQADPTSAAAYFNRGMEYYLQGDAAKAYVDLAMGATLAPKEPYPALLLDIVARKNGLPSRLADAAAKLDMNAWPAPAIRLALGQTTPDALISAAAAGDAARAANRRCEALFYAGEGFAHAGKADEAGKRWSEALAVCPPATPERSYASKELQALKTNQP